jgi:hypothetical protein
LLAAAYARERAAGQFARPAACTAQPVRSGGNWPPPPSGSDSRAALDAGEQHVARKGGNVGLCRTAAVQRAVEPGNCEPFRRSVGDDVGKVAIAVLARQRVEQRGDQLKRPS